MIFLAGELDTCCMNHVSRSEQSLGCIPRSNSFLVLGLALGTFLAGEKRLRRKRFDAVQYLS